MSSPTGPFFLPFVVRTRTVVFPSGSGFQQVYLFCSLLPRWCDVKTRFARAPFHVHNTLQLEAGHRKTLPPLASAVTGRSLGHPESLLRFRLGDGLMLAGTTGLLCFSFTRRSFGCADVHRCLGISLSSSSVSLSLCPLAFGGSSFWISLRLLCFAVCFLLLQFEGQDKRGYHYMHCDRLNHVFLLFSFLFGYFCLGGVGERELSGL